MLTSLKSRVNIDCLQTSTILKEGDMPWRFKKRVLGHIREDHMKRTGKLMELGVQGTIKLEDHQPTFIGH